MTHLLVGLMPFVKEEEMQEHVSVSQNTLEIPTSHADQSVLFTVTVPPTKHARGTSASTPALVLVVSMQGAGS